MKIIFMILLSFLSLSNRATAVEDLPVCTLLATLENRLPADVQLSVSTNSDRWSRAPYLFNFYERQLPAHLATITDRSLMETIVGFFGRRLHPKVMSIDAYVHSANKLEVILYVLKTSRGSALSSLLLIDGVGGSCQ